jgi:hypothetical protein
MPMPHRTKRFPVSLRRAMTSTMELGGKVDGRIERRADEPFFCGAGSGLQAELPGSALPMTISRCIAYFQLIIRCDPDSHSPPA